MRACVCVCLRPTALPYGPLPYSPLPAYGTPPAYGTLPMADGLWPLYCPLPYSPLRYGPLPVAQGHVAWRGLWAYQRISLAAKRPSGVSGV